MCVINNVLVQIEVCAWQGAFGIPDPHAGILVFGSVMVYCSFALELSLTAVVYQATLGPFRYKSVALLERLIC